jgi:23S rRNA (guanosine2251-2'-O)-methyltransferase
MVAAGGRPRRPGARSEGSSLGGEQVEGRQAVLELLRARRRPVRDLWVAAGAQGPAVAEVAELAAAAGVAWRQVPRERLAAAARTEAPQGMLARADPVRPATLAELVAGRVGRQEPPRAGPGPAIPFLVVLDGVTDPGNLGAIMRTALGAGATGVVLGRHRSAHLTPAAVKAAAGAVEHLSLAVVPGIPAALAELDRRGVWTVGLDAGGTTDVWDLDVATEPVALVLGAEGAGMSRLALQRCRVVARIPAAGPLPSLNVAAAAAVACFAVARRRRPGTSGAPRTN